MRAAAIAAVRTVGVAKTAEARAEEMAVARATMHTSLKENDKHTK